MKKSELKKQLKSLQNDVAEIQKQLFENKNITFSLKPNEKYLHNKTEVENTIEKTIQENTINELTELPEKWCVKYDFCHLNIIVKFLNWKTKVQTESGYLYSYINIHALTNEKPSGYTEITFDQFKKWLLKEDEKKEALNQARKDTNNAIEEAIKNIEKLSIREVQVKVSTQEEAEECARIAVENGEKLWESKWALDLVYVNNLFRTSQNATHFGFFSNSKNHQKITLQQFKEYYSKPKEIDWSKAGQLVEGTYTTAITTGKHDDYNFEGFVIKVTDDSDNNHLCNTLIKSKFKLCTQPITIKND